MYEKLIKQVVEAINLSSSWAQTGWKTSFGERGVEACSLPEALELASNFVYREEAVDYWTQVQLIGGDAAESGKKALDALKNGDLKRAEDSVYFSMYIEKPYAPNSNTWGPVHEALKQEMTGSPR